MIRCRYPLKREAHGFVEPPGIAERDPEIAELTQLLTHFHILEL